MTTNNRPTVQEIHEKLDSLVGTTYELPITTNKGKPGQHLEKLLGIPQSSACLDCADGELKLFPVKKTRAGLVPKETIAVTMLDRDELRTNDFASSKCCKKMSRVLVVPYLREGDTIQYLAPTLIDKENPAYKSLYDQFEQDYNAIRQGFIETGLLESKTGVFLQNRTKGPGHGSTSRAFYLRPACMKQYVPITVPVPVPEK
jgi:hypothetical protein